MHPPPPPINALATALISSGLLKSGLLQLVICRLVTTFRLATTCSKPVLDNTFRQSTSNKSFNLTTYNRPVVNKLSQACKRIKISACCNKDINSLLQLARFWLCIGAYTHLLVFQCW